MYDDLSLDYTYDQAFNLDEDYAERLELDENDEYARESKDFQELAYQHYAWKKVRDLQLLRIRVS